MAYSNLITEYGRHPNIPRARLSRRHQMACPAAPDSLQNRRGCSEVAADYPDGEYGSYSYCRDGCSIGVR